MDINMVGREYCSRCGIETFSFSRKYSVSTGMYYCVKCAEKLDREYLLKNSCAMCKRLLKASEIKIVVPSSMFGRTPLVRADRVICATCHKKFGSQTRVRMPSSRIARIREQIRKGIARRSMEHQPPQPEPQRMIVS